MDYLRGGGVSAPVGVGVRAFLADESGVTVIEYALLGGLIAVVAVTGIGATGTNVAALWNRISSLIAAAMTGG